MDKKASIMQMNDGGCKVAEATSLTPNDDKLPQSHPTTALQRTVSLAWPPQHRAEP